jgi:hypothetical protein
MPMKMLPKISLLPCFAAVVSTVNT